jgi:hypothetical protein
VTRSKDDIKSATEYDADRGIDDVYRTAGRLLAHGNVRAVVIEPRRRRASLALGVLAGAAKW